MSEKKHSEEKTVSDSLVIFKKVNNKISELIDCSVKDFDILNKNFKNYYNSLNDISKTSLDFINFLISLDEDKDFSFLKNQVQLSSITLKESTSAYLSKLKDLGEKLNYYLLITNNLNQDLNTIRLLFTNLNFDPFIHTDGSEVNTEINKTIESLNAFEKEISNLQAILFKTTRFTDEGFINALDLYTEQYNNITLSYEHVSQLGKTAQKHKKSLLKLEEKRSQNTSEIITNLQFQDILRQKIEHVQEAHEEILNDLVNIKDDKDTLSPEKLFKIRDISTLQSAQLIHSNQEYQTAVETILSRINELNTLLNKYSSIWNHFCMPERTKLRTIKVRLGEQISRLNTQSFYLTDIAEKFDTNVDLLNKQIKSLHTFLNKEEFNLSSFLKIQDIFSNLEEKYSNKEKYGALGQLKFELDKFHAKYKKLKDGLDSFIVEFPQEELSSAKDYRKDVDIIDEFSKRNSQYFSNSLGSKIDKLLNTQIKVNTDNNFNIKEVSYYKVFENEINKIISLLDGLLVKINISKENIDLDTLEHLRKNYTMDSERMVHDLISKQYGNKSSENEKDNKNDIEFF